MRFKILLLSSLILLTVAGLSIYKYQYHSNVYAEESTPEVVVEIDTTETIIPESKVLFGMVVDSLVVIEDVIKPRQNLSHILAAYNVSGNVINEISLKSKGVFDLRALAANKKYTLLCSPDSINTPHCFIYEPNDLEYVVFNLKDSVDVYKVEREVEVVQKSISGIINTSLSNAMTENGASPQLVHILYDVFKWQIEFNRVYKGDKYKLIYEEKQVEGVPVGVGRVLGAYFEHSGKDYFGIPFDQGKGVEFFDDKGENLRRAFLKEPVNYTRISSRFTKKRFHPVQKRYKAHLGTDYAAPHGTPIISVGDGVIVEARYGQFNGNFVKIKHNSAITTQYLHMSKIAKGIKRGTRVKQGQVIGYVGSTGLASGPHLCFRFWKNGVQVDALKVITPPSDPIKTEFTNDYAVVKDSVILKLQNIDYSEVEDGLMAIQNPDEDEPQKR